MKKKRLVSIFICALVLLMALCAGCKKEDGSEEDLTPPIKPVITVPETDDSQPDVEPETDTQPEQDLDPQPITYTGRVYNTDNGVNVRKEPSTDADILTTADVGEIFTVLEAGEWCKIQLSDGTIGYIKGEFLELTPNS